MRPAIHPLLDLDARPVVGHRGNSAHAPENTLASFGQAVALGVDALELDVRRTRDGAIVVCHDATLARTTGDPRAVADCTLTELRRLDAGATFTPDGGRTHPYRGLGLQVPTLDEVLGTWPDVPLLIEVKVPAAAAGTRAILEARGAEARCIVASFDRRALHAFDGSRVARGCATAQVAPLCLPALLGARFRTLPFQVMSLPRRFRGVPVPLGALARAAAPAGVPVHVWTVNDAAVARRLWWSGVRGILSDDPGTILAARSALDAERGPTARGR